jgi:hypothetical protein
MATSPTQLTLKRLRESGEYPLIQIVERWNAFSRTRIDLFNIFDILAIDNNGDTVGIQVTSKGNINARIKKIEESVALPHLRKAGWTIIVEGWYKEANKWKSKIKDIS